MGRTAGALTDHDLRFSRKATPAPVSQIPPPALTKDECGRLKAPHLLMIR